MAPPYGIIYRAIKNGGVIPFLGAGASLSGRPSGGKWIAGEPFLPTGRELALQLKEESEFPPSQLAELCKQFKSELKEVQVQLQEAQTKLAALPEVAAIELIQAPIQNAREQLRDLESEILALDDLAKVASYFEESSDRDLLRETLHDVFYQEYEPGEVHKFLADIETPCLIVTTNYDDLIEQAFAQRDPPRPYHLVVHPSDLEDLAASVLWWKPGASEPEHYPPARLPLILVDTPIIYKMHGSIDRQSSEWESYVITEDDYVDFLTRMTGNTAIPAGIKQAFRSKRFLFLGYGLNDWNLRVILNRLKTDIARPKLDEDEESKADEDKRGTRSSELRSWAIQYHPSKLEEWLWGRRNVNIYDEEIDHFIKEIRKKMV